MKRVDAIVMLVGIERPYLAIEGKVVALIPHGFVQVRARLDRGGGREDDVRAQWFDAEPIRKEFGPTTRFICWPAGS